mmetsp:Transcript_8544/g.21996  ORF Transcript_8544/g.21996 Transcript_8544/m.21996 type:complete len:282 (+) Transcript_8544:15-860(+)
MLKGAVVAVAVAAAVGTAAVVRAAVPATGPLTLPPPLDDSFTTYNSSVWEYADSSMGVTDGCKVWYLKNQSMVNANLSLGQGRGLRMVMSASPCKANTTACNGAKMAADHLTSVAAHLDGDYELKMRAPYQVGTDGDVCNPGVYAYFTAGYVNKDGKWNEMNFGFHPDRDNGGTAVSCEHHDDTGSYHETTVPLGFNYRKTFATFKVIRTKDRIDWAVGKGDELPKTIHSVDAKLTEPMTTRLIFRTNFRDGDPGFMPDHVFEIAHFKFFPRTDATKARAD